MKIISNFKDYYDFLTGKYGIDEKCVYERVCSTEGQDGKWWKAGIYKPKHLEPGAVYSFDMIAVCGTLYCCFFYRGKYYFGAEAANHIPKVVNSDGYATHTTEHINLAKSFHLQKTDINEKEQCPVVLVENKWSGMEATVKNIKLSDFDFAKVLPAEEIYIQISSFLLKEKPVVDNRTDVQKIVGKGFDKKTSFRNTK